MMKYVTMGALGLALALSLALTYAWSARNHHKARADALEATVQALEVDRDIARNAQRIAAQRAAAEAQRVKELQRSIEHLLTGDFGNVDEDLDPALRAYFECLRSGNDASACAAGSSGTP